MVTKSHKVVHTNYVHKPNILTRETKLIKIGKRTFKFTYDVHNSSESFVGELFDGNKFNHIFSMMDVNSQSTEHSPYIMRECELLERIEMLTKKGLDFIKLLVDDEK